MPVAVRRALVIDDSPLVQKLVRELLEGAGFIVDEALDGDIGLDRAARGPVDVIVCDLSMPRRSGLETIAGLKRVVPRVPIVVLTEQNEAQPAVEAMKLGAAAWVRKGDDLLGPLEAALEQSRVEAVRRSQAQALERATSDTLGYLLDQSPEPLMVHRHGIIVRVNPHFLKCFGLAHADELIGQPVLMNAPQSDRARIAATLRNSDAGLGTDLETFSTQRADGSSIEIEAMTLPIVYQGQPASLSILRDLTERRRAEAKLVMTDRLTSMGIVAAGAAHEINNPLAFMLANHEWLTHELEGASEDVRQVLGEIGEGLSRIRTIAADLKGMSRESETLTPVDVRRELEHAMRMAAPAIKGKATLVSDLHDVAPISGHANRLTQVFLNLLINASQAMADKRPTNQVSVKLAQDEQHITVQISDNGPGMPPAVLARLFQPFFTTKPTGVGTGLGLHISKNIVESHAGQISVESRVGEGTTFCVRFPRAAQ